MKNILKIDISTYFLFLFSLLAGYIKESIIIFIIVFVHEMGHVLLFLLFKIKVLGIRLYPFGGITYVSKRIHERIYKDIICNVGGILFQVILGIIFYYLYLSNVIVRSTYLMFCFYNKMIFVFNILPIIPLDGSKLVLAILSKFISFRKSYILMIVVSIISLCLFILFNGFRDVMLCFFLIYSLIYVIKEYRYVRYKFYLERVMYDNYYNGIISNKKDIKDLRIDKYYYFYDDKKYINERDFIKNGVFIKR